MLPHGNTLSTTLSIPFAACIIICWHTCMVWLTHCQQTVSCDSKEQYQHWLRKWLASCRHKAFNAINADLSSVISSGTQPVNRAISHFRNVLNFYWDSSAQTLLVNGWTTLLFEDTCDTVNNSKKVNAIASIIEIFHLITHCVDSRPDYMVMHQ